MMPLKTLTALALAMTVPARVPGRRRGAMVPGAALIATDAPIVPETTGQALTILANGPASTARD